MTTITTMLAATAIFTQAQLKYGAQRSDFLHRWYERPLHQDTSYADATDAAFLNVPAWRKTVETLRLGGMDGIAFFASKQDQRWDVLEKSLMPGGETQVLFELSIAKGVAVCESTDTTPDTVFVRADEAMYAEKRRMKALSKEANLRESGE